MDPPDFSIGSELRDGILHITMRGFTTDGSVARFIEEKVEDILTHPNIWDVREYRLDNESYANLKFFLYRTRESAKRLHGVKVALLCANAVQYGVCRQLELIAKTEEHPVNIRPFRSLESAIAWVREEA